MDAKYLIQVDINEAKNLASRLLCFSISTVAIVRGHVVGASCMFVLAHDYHLMSSNHGFIFINECRMPKTKPIFLCHSGAQKDFTKKMCLDLHARHRYPFFDMFDVHSGDDISEVIFQTAKQCRIAVLVLSEEFFNRSKWPMLEVLDAQTSGRNPHLKIIPLFFQLPCKDFKARALSWVQKWKEWAMSDDHIDVVKWQEAVQKLKRIKGIEFQPGMTEVAYRRSIVQTICELVPVDNREDLTSIHGSQIILKIMKPIMENFKFGMQRNWCWKRCPTLCIVELQKKVLTELTQASNKWLEELTDFDIDQKYVKEHMTEHKVFLALDYVSDTQSLQVARMFLACEFKAGHGH